MTEHRQVKENGHLDLLSPLKTVGVREEEIKWNRARGKRVEFKWRE